MTHLILYFPGELMHSNFSGLSAEAKKKVLDSFAETHDKKPLQVGYSGGIEIGQVIGVRVQQESVGLVIEWRDGIEVTRLEGAIWPTTAQSR